MAAAAFGMGAMRGWLRALGSRSSNHGSLGGRVHSYLRHEASWPLPIIGSARSTAAAASGSRVCARRQIDSAGSLLMFFSVDVDSLRQKEVVSHALNKRLCLLPSHAFLPFAFTSSSSIVVPCWYQCDVITQDPFLVNSILP